MTPFRPKVDGIESDQLRVAVVARIFARLVTAPYFHRYFSVRLLAN